MLKVSEYVICLFPDVKYYVEHVNGMAHADRNRNIILTSPRTPFDSYVRY